MIRLTPKQTVAWKTILAAPAYRRILFDGGARSTKTACICTWLLEQAGRYPGIRILCARKNRNAAKKSLFDDTFAKLTQGCRRNYAMTGELEIRCRNGSLIRIDGLDDADRVDKILGTEYGHIFFNEATQITWDTVQTVLSRLAQPMPGLPARKAIFDCNPKGQRHWLYQAGVLHRNPGNGETLPDAATWARMHWTPYDNPHLPPDALATLESLTGTQRRRMLGGEWCDQEGQVYQEFDEDLHVAESMPPGWERWERIRGIDFGYTNPFVCLWGALDPDGRLWIYRERYLRNVIVSDHAAAIVAAEPGNYHTVADHDAEDRATLARCGVSTEAAHKDVLPGIEAVKRRLRPRGDGRPGLMILQECRETIGELYDYAWAPGKDGKNAKEAPIKDRDHSMDTMRYMVMALDHQSGASVANPAFYR